MTHLLCQSTDADAIDCLFDHIHMCQRCTATLESVSPGLLKEQATPVATGLGPAWSAVTQHSLFACDDEFFRRNSHLRMLRELGSGSMGRVYECVEVSSSRHVAVKVLNRDKATPGMIGRIEREAQIQARFDHPNIVRLHELGSDRGIPFLVMELVPGCNLRELLSQRQLPHRVAAACLRDIARGVAAAHDQGVLHRDLKPANILLEGATRKSSQTKPGEEVIESLRPKITDFGLAKVFNESAEISNSQLVVGTPAYMSPEQIRTLSGRLTAASDLYSIGVMLYEMLTGRVPFAGEDQSELFQAILYREPVAPRQWRVSIPQDLETICMKCLEKAPTHRYASATELADDLDRFLVRRPIKARPIGVWQKAVRRMRANPLPAISAMVLCVSVISLVAGAAIYVRNQTLLREQAEQQREQARHNEAIAQQRADQLRDKYFEEQSLIREIYYALRHPGQNVDDKVLMDQIYEKIVTIRFHKAREMITIPELLSQKSEPMVEAFYLAGMKAQEIDQDLAKPYFEEAVRRAMEIKELRTLTDNGRFCAMNSLNYLGVFRYQRKDTDGSLVFFKKAWDEFRLQPGEEPADDRLKKFSLMVGRNYLEQLETLKRAEEAAALLEEIQKIEQMQVGDAN